MQIDPHGPWLEPPPIPGHWRDLTQEHATALLQRVDAADSPFAPEPLSTRFAVERIRARPLAFYPGCLLVDMTGWVPPRDAGARRPSRRALASVVYGPKGTLFLDGNAAPIHRLNGALSLALRPETAGDYLRFFCAFIHGEMGPFRIVEQVADLTLAADAGAGAAATIQSVLEPLAHQPAPEVATAGADAPETPLRFTACVQHGPRLYKGLFDVFSGGMVTMVDDLLLGDLPLAPVEYEGPFRFPSLPVMSEP